MSGRDDGWWVALAALIVLGMRDNNKTIPWGAGWVWPIPDLNLLDRKTGRVEMYRAALSQEFRAGGSNPHYGVDLMYRSASPPPMFFAPPGVPILAARAGKLWSVQRTTRGLSVVVDHGVPFATFYQHLEALDPAIVAAVDAKRVGVNGAAITAGQRLGTMGADPTDPQGIRHLHFAVWYNGSGDVASVDPAPVMSSWGRLSWTA